MSADTGSVLLSLVDVLCPWRGPGFLPTGVSGVSPENLRALGMLSILAVADEDEETDPGSGSAGIAFVLSAGRASNIAASQPLAAGRATRG